MVDRINKGTGIYILNRDIVYGSKDKCIGVNNYFLTEFYNISKYDVESTLIKIFTKNPDVIYHTIGYSEKENLLYVYSNKEIDKNIEDEYENEIGKDYESIRDLVEYLLTTEDNYDTSYISLYDLSNVLLGYYRVCLKISESMWKDIKKMDKILGSRTYEVEFIPKRDSITLFNSLMTGYTEYKLDNLPISNSASYDLTNKISKKLYKFEKVKKQFIIRSDFNNILNLYIKMEPRYNRVDNYKLTLLVSTVLGNFKINLNEHTSAKKGKIITDGNYFGSRNEQIITLTNDRREKILKMLKLKINSLPDEIREDCYKERLANTPSNKRLDNLNIKPNIPRHELLLENIRLANILNDEVIISKVNNLIDKYQENVKSYENRLINKNISLSLEEFTPDIGLEILTEGLEFIYNNYFIDCSDYYNFLYQLQLSRDIDSYHFASDDMDIVNIFKTLYEVIFKYLDVSDYKDTEYYKLITKYIDITSHEIKNINRDKSDIRDIKDIEISFRYELQQLLLNTQSLVQELELSNKIIEDIKVLCSDNLDKALIDNTDKVINELYSVINKIKSYNIDDVNLNKLVFKPLCSKDSLYKLDDVYYELINKDLGIYNNLINILELINNRKINGEIDLVKFYQEIEVVLIISYKVLFVLENYYNKKDDLVKYKRLYRLKNKHNN